MLLLLRLLDRIRPREGWLILILVLSAVLCAPAALVAATQAAGSGRLVWLTLAGALTGLGLARSRLNWRQAAVSASVLGSGLVVIVLGRVLPPPSLLWAETGHSAAWLRAWLAGSVPATPPFTATGLYVWQRLAAFGERLMAWGQAAAGSSPATDPIGFVLLMALLAWGVGSFATWQVYRRHAPLAGLLPAGLGVAMAVFLSGGGRYLLFIYLFCTLALVAAVNVWARHQYWDRAGFDYPAALGLDIGMVVAAWVLAVVMLGGVFPHVRSQRVSRAFWELVDRPYSAVEQATARLFGKIEGRYPGGTGLGVLPREHLLSGEPDLGRRVALYVSTNDPPPPLPEMNEPVEGPGTPRRYWRGVVYDIYTGHGWEHGPLESRGYREDQPLDVTPPPGPELRQAFDIVEPGQESLYAVNEPLVLDQPVQAWWQSSGDLAYIQGDARRYTVISRPVEPSVAELRAAPATLPPEVAERYLALPDALPARVRDLAVQIAGGEGTRYDQASAIEQYLRTYTYTLDVPLPPADRDVVDYFLFDLKKGYCDYYASAMVVMARAAGVPARFASGYAQGTYDHRKRRWTVTELDAHSWVEIYFDGIGWVEFEPTAGQPALQRPGGVAPGQPQAGTKAAPGLLGGIPWPLLALPAVLALLVTLVLAIWLPRRARAMPAAELVRDRYQRLVRWGYRLGRPPRIGQTPFEYSAALGDALRARGQDSRRSQVREAAAEAPGEVQELTEGLVRSLYAPRPLDESEGRRIQALWERLRRHLRRLLLR